MKDVGDFEYLVIEDMSGTQRQYQPHMLHPKFSCLRCS